MEFQSSRLGFMLRAGVLVLYFSVFYFRFSIFLTDFHILLLIF